MNQLLKAVLYAGIIYGVAFLLAVSVLGGNSNTLVNYFLFVSVVIAGVMYWFADEVLEQPDHSKAIALLVLASGLGMQVGWKAALFIFGVFATLALMVFARRYASANEVSIRQTLSLMAALFGATAIPRMMANQGGEDILSVAMVIAISAVLSWMFARYADFQFGLLPKKRA